MVGVESGADAFVAGTRSGFGGGAKGVAVLEIVELAFELEDLLF